MNVVKNDFCRPHPQATSLLFKYKRDALTVFRDVIGINEIDHLSIACINAAEEIIFFSYTPSLEYNLLSSSLWQFDLANKASFYKNSIMMSWDSLYHIDRYDELRQEKLLKNKFYFGFSMPVIQDNLHIIYSFATKTRLGSVEDYFQEKQVELGQMGQYCFNKLSPIILPTDFHHSLARPKNVIPELKLIINNKHPQLIPSETLETL